MSDALTPFLTPIASGFEGCEPEPDDLLSREEIEALDALASTNCAAGAPDRRCRAVATSSSDSQRPEWVIRFLRKTATERQAILEEVLGREITGTWPPFWLDLYAEVRERGLVDRLRERVSL